MIVQPVKRVDKLAEKEARWGTHCDAAMKEVTQPIAQGWVGVYTDGSAKEFRGWMQAGFLWGLVRTQFRSSSACDVAINSMLARSLASWQIYAYMRTFYENGNGHFLGHRGVYRCKFGVNGCILLRLHYFMMQLAFVLQVVCFLSFCSHCCHSYMVVQSSFARVVG